MFDKALVFLKKSSYRKYFLERKKKRLQSFLERNPSFTDSLTTGHEINEGAIEQVRSFLEGLGIQAHFTYDITKKQARNFPLIITVGGDGTLLRASHYTECQPVFGINSNPASSIGYLCTCSVDELEEKFPRILRGDVEPLNVNRIEVAINNRVVPYPALNDLLFAAVTPAATTRYSLTVGRVMESQKSSGVWVSTAAGSTAAIRAAGGIIMPIRSSGIQYLVREPYQEKSKIYRLTRGIVSEGIEIVSTTFDAGIYIDGENIRYTAGFGDRIVIRPSPNPLRLFLF